MPDSIRIEPLNTELLDDYLAFFENGIPEGEWGHSCYCAAFCGKDNSNETGMERAEVRRDAAIRYIREGCLTGFLAYEGEETVGWCSVGDREACRSCFGVRWIIGGELPESEERAVSVFCFEIRPDKRRHHIASALLDRVTEDARKKECAFVEAYPMKEGEDVLENYSGHLGFYEKRGFKPVAETEKRLIVRKYLHLGD